MIWQLNEAELADEMTKVLKITLHHLHEEGRIDQETLEDYGKNVFVTIKAPSKISTWWNKIFQDEQDKPKIFLSRQLSLRTEKQEIKRDFNVLEFGKEK